MKKMKTVAAAFMAVLMAGSVFGAFAGCKRYTPPPFNWLDVDDIVELDTKKTQINIQYFNGGTGAAWIGRLANKFNESQSKYQIYPMGKKNDSVEIATNIRGGGKEFSAYFSVSPDWMPYVAEGNLFEDLSGFMDRKPDGEDGLSIREKITFEGWEDIYSLRGKGCYALPWVLTAAGGFVYDHSRFTDFNSDNPNESWLKLAPQSDKAKVDADLALLGKGISSGVSGGGLVYRGTETRYYKDGDTILSAGRDKKYGTYDDGQPETESEFQQLLYKIQGKGKVPFIQFNNYGYNYQTAIALSVFAQYMGPKAAETYLSHGAVPGKFSVYNKTAGQYEMKDINAENGYLVHSMEGFEPAIRFLDDYIGNVNYQHPFNKSGQITHTDAQNYFAAGSLGAIPGNTEAAFLVEHGRWENEAKIFLGELDNKYPGKNFAYGKHDYRYLLPPAIEGQKGIDGHGNGSVLSCGDAGVFVVRKHGADEQEKLSVLTDFLEFTLSNDALQDFTVTSGILRPYKYTFTDDNLAKLSKFARYIYDAYNDTDNVYVLPIQTLAMKNPIVYTLSQFNVSTQVLPTRIGGGIQQPPMSFLYNNRYNPDRVNLFITGQRDVLNSSQWATAMSNLEFLDI